ncbi:FHA domain-containing protein [Nocardioides aequoreus]|uniref:FHA domain-containing protein n=1 Tax=Nocardioides aequoreus TaxID=397278 RepID=UPI000B16C9AB|nr:FHA domain-containing protein [Nocardioides aequoreus]
MADLRVSVRPEGREPIGLSLSGSGSRLTLQVDDASAFAGQRDAVGVRDIADMLARWGLVIDVVDTRGRRLLSVGDVRAPWWQRPVTRTRHLRVAASRGVLAALRGRTRPSQQLLPSGGVGVPPTPLPIAPTFLRRQVRRIASTDTAYGGGSPRLVLLPADGIWRPELPTFWLQQATTTIGSDPSCTVVLPGLAPVHAEVRVEEGDEYVLVARDRRTSVHGEPVTRQVLRTSARIQLAETVLTFVREEFADHGRPHGGRVGGELGRQRPQHG